MPKKNANYPQLRARMALLGYTSEELSREAGLSSQSLCCRLSGCTDWRLDEIYRVCRVLEIPPAEIPAYFPPGQLRPGAGRWKS